jgi:hypothetical protein
VFQILNGLTIKYALIINFLLALLVFPQVDSTIQKYRDDLKGNILNRREGLFNANLVRTLFYNNGEIGHWPQQPSGEWPIGTGQSYLDGLAILIASELTAPGNNQIIHPLQTSYREWMDKDPNTGEIWGLEPIPGYSNPNSSKPAMSNDSTTWPYSWPIALNLPEDWNGHWYGYFGRDVFNANLETFYVMDDSRDKEWTRTPFNYFPLTSDSDRAGLGLRIEVRGFQWNQELIEDFIFWHYDIINISDFSYPKTFFGYYTDCGVGGTSDSEDDCASFDKTINMTYCFDGDGIGIPGNWITGYLGYAYLQTPGNGFDGIDNDEDGMIDERQDDGIDNDGDWISFTDLNSNGIWDPDESEPLNDDVGKDGLSPLDPNYLTPDEGEGDGLPTDGEPNFDARDNDESDQIGLTAVSIYRLGQGGTGGGWPKDDESMWLKMSSAIFDTSWQRANISIVFSSGPLQLSIGQREKYSMAVVFGENLDDLIYNKNIAQLFYDNNYKSVDSLTLINQNYFTLTPKDFYLSQNYPNPFNPSTKISFDLPLENFVSIKVYDVLGNEVATLINENKRAGNYEVEFNASSLSSGIYLYRIKTENFTQTKKMVLLR